jgi:glycerol transport system ATP-binding protein
MRVAQVFSDPPLNVVNVEKSGTAIRYEGGTKASANGLYARLADGAYRVGFRAHQLALANGQADHHVFPLEVAVTEITGSESFVHFKRNGSNWVAVLEGVHEFLPGQPLKAALDPNDVFIFDASDRLVAAPISA